MSGDVAASVHARLANQARADDRPFQELLQYYGLERFLYRLSKSDYRDRFILKGALMLRVWNAPMTRPTRDIDFLGYTDNSVESLEDIIRTICALETEDDGLKFDPQSVRGERIKEDADYEGVRIKFIGLLGQARIPMQLDIAFGDVANDLAACDLSKYGHVIVDECHHVPAVSFERVMKQIKAKYVTGLTATPKRA